MSIHSETKPHPDRPPLHPNSRTHTHTRRTQPSQNPPCASLSYTLTYTLSHPTRCTHHTPTAHPCIPAHAHTPTRAANLPWRIYRAYPCLTHSHTHFLTRPDAPTTPRPPTPTSQLTHTHPHAPHTTLAESTVRVPVSIFPRHSFSLAPLPQRFLPNLSFSQNRVRCGSLAPSQHS